MFFMERLLVGNLHSESCFIFSRPLMWVQAESMFAGVWGACRALRSVLHDLSLGLNAKGKAARKDIVKALSSRKLDLLFDLFHANPNEVGWLFGPYNPFSSRQVPTWH